jgi:hypothetical protein
VWTLLELEGSWMWYQEEAYDEAKRAHKSPHAAYIWCKHYQSLC